MNQQIINVLDELHNYGVLFYKDSQTELSNEDITDEKRLLDGFESDGYYHLEKLFITKDVRIVKWNGLGRFNFNKFEVDPANEVFQSVNGVLYTKKGYDRLGKYCKKKMKELVACPTTIIEHDIAIGTDRICNCAFKGSNISILNLPDTVKEIGTNSFSYAKNLNTIVLPRSICRIEPQKADSIPLVSGINYQNLNWPSFSGSNLELSICLNNSDKGILSKRTNPTA